MELRKKNFFLSSRVLFYEWMGRQRNKLLSFDDGYPEILNCETWMTRWLWSVCGWSPRRNLLQLERDLGTDGWMIVCYLNLFFTSGFEAFLGWVRGERLLGVSFILRSFYPLRSPSLTPLPYTLPLPLPPTFSLPYPLAPSLLFPPPPHLHFIQCTASLTTWPNYHSSPLHHNLKTRIQSSFLLLRSLWWQQTARSPLKTFKLCWGMIYFFIRLKLQK